MARDLDLGSASEDEPSGIDPLADLLFTLIAAVLPAILLLAPMLHMSARAVPHLPRTESHAPPAAPEVQVEGRRVQPIVAGPDGLRLTGEANRVVAPDRIPDDAGLRELLERLRRDGEPALLVVEPGGLESAFLFEPVAALHGPAEIQQVRAATACAAARDPALILACGAAAPGGGVRP